MKTTVLSISLLLVANAAGAADPRIREISYDPAAVIPVETRRGSVTHIELPSDEAIRFVASGQGADCRQPEMLWCIDGPSGQRNVFLKPRLGAGANTLSIVTDKRSYSFALTVLPDSSSRPGIHRLVVRAPGFGAATRAQAQATQHEMPQMEQLVNLQDLMAAQASRNASRATLGARLQLAPDVLNADYSLALGSHSEEIVPEAVYDDGRFTYLRFPGNRELPAVFQVAEDGSESIVNARMENDLLVVDRVTKRLVLRKGEAVVQLTNENFDLNGRPPVLGTTAAGVERVFLFNGRHDRGNAQ